MKTVEYPTDGVLKEKYYQIEQSGLDVLRSGRLVGNPLLEQGQFWRGDRWSISTGGYVFNSDAGLFLERVSKQLAVCEPALLTIKPEFLHLTFTELVHLQSMQTDISNLPNLRREANIRTDDILSYYCSLRHHFPQRFDPIRLRLFKLFVTVDPGNTHDRTGALVAAFLTESDDDVVFQVKDAIMGAVVEGGRYFSSQYGIPSQVLFVTLGRFSKSPSVNTLLTQLEDYNSQIDKEHLTDIKDIKVITTSKLDYRSSRGHIEIWPPIALQAKDQIQAGTRFLTPSKRIRYHRLQEMLEKDR